VTDFDTETERYVILTHCIGLAVAWHNEFLKWLVQAGTVGYLFLDRNPPVNSSSRFAGERYGHLPLPAVLLSRRIVTIQILLLTYLLTLSYLISCTLRLCRKPTWLIAIFLLVVGIGYLAKQKRTISRILQKRLDMEQFHHVRTVFVKEDRETEKVVQKPCLFMRWSRRVQLDSRRIILRLARATKSLTLSGSYWTRMLSKTKIKLGQSRLQDKPFLATCHLSLFI